MGLLGERRAQISKYLSKRPTHSPPGGAEKLFIYSFVHSFKNFFLSLLGLVLEKQYKLGLSLVLEK